MDRAFRELRSVMNLSSLNREARHKVWSLVRAINAYDPEFYLAVCQPYIAGFAHHFHEPLIDVRSVIHLERGLHLLPFVRFRLHLELAHGKSLRGFEQLMRDSVRRREIMSHLFTLTIRCMDRKVHDVFEALALSEDAQRLALLDVGQNALPHDLLLPLWSMPLLSTVQVISLNHCDMDSGALMQWAEVAPWTCLFGLSLSGNPIDDDGLRFIAQAPDFGRLRYLSVTGGAWGYDGGRALESSKYLRPEVKRHYRSSFLGKDVLLASCT